MQDRRELLELLSALCDEQLTEAQQVRLEELLADEDARRLYLQYMDMHARLLTHPALGDEHRLSSVDALTSVVGAAAESAPSGHSVGNALRGVPRFGAATEGGAYRGKSATGFRRTQLRQIASYVAVAVATLAATVLVQVALRRPEKAREATVQVPPAESYVATLAQAASAQWGAATQTYRPGARVLAGELELRRGIARLAYDGGVELIVEGPATLYLDSASAATLVAGRVVFRADDAAPPFTLSTPSSLLVDWGTEYAVEVRQQHEEVHVFSGEVQRTPKVAADGAGSEMLAAGEARRYGDSISGAGEPAAIDPGKFVRQFPLPELDPGDWMAALLAYEGFEYEDGGALRDETAAGGSGFASAWGGGLARAPNERRDDQFALNVSESLVRAGSPAASAGGSFDHTGFAKYFRLLATPVRLDSDGVYYFSFLFRREGPPQDPLNSVSLQLRESQELAGDQRDATTDLRKRLNFGVDRTNELFTHLERIGRRMPLPLSYGETYLLVAKVAASGTHPDQVFLRVYGPHEPVDAVETAAWSAVGPPIRSDLVFDWLEIHINSHTRQTIDEIRLGTTWAAVVAPWASDLQTQR